MSQQGGDTHASEWSGLYDQTDTVKRVLAEDVGFDPAAPDRAALADFWEAYGRFIEARASIGPAAMDLLRTPVANADEKLAAMRDHCYRQGRSWPSVERKLHIPWHEQVRMITRGHESRLWTWGLEQRIDFEEMARAGASVRSLQRMFRLPERQIENLVKLFR